MMSVDAFGVGEHLGVGVAHLELGQTLGAELLVDDAGSLPDDEVRTLGLTCHPAGQVAIGREDQGLAVEGARHLHRVRRGADQVAHRLHLGAAVDVGQHGGARVGVDEVAEGVGGTAVGQGAAGGQVGNHDGAVGVQDLRRLGHEVDAAEGDHVPVHLRGGARQGQGVAHEVGEILDLVLLVVVGQQDGVALLLELEDRLLEVFGEVVAKRCGHDKR